MSSHSLVRRAASITLGATLALSITGFIAHPSPAIAAPGDTEYSNMVLNVGSEPTDRNFVWYSTSSDPQVVRITSANGDTRDVEPTAQGASLEQAGLTWFHASASGFEPGQTYTWQVGSDELGWSDPYAITVNGGDGAYRGVAFGDPQIGSGGGDPTDAAGWDRTLSAAVNDPDVADRLDSIITLGDQVNEHSDPEQYQQFLAPDELRTNMLAPNIGNHDDASPEDPAHAFAQHFNLPNQMQLEGWSEVGMGDYWYINDGVLFVSLNSNEKDPAAHEQFLRDVFAEHGQDVNWRVVTWHHALYSTASHSTDSDIAERRAWMAPLMSELNVDVVLNGHDHVYTRSHLINRGHPVGDLSAPAELAKFPGETLYFSLTSGSGSKFYDVEDKIEWPFNAVTVQDYTPSYATLEATEDSFRLVAKHDDGTVIDDVTLTRAPEDATPNPVPEGPAQVEFQVPPAADEPTPNTFDEATGEYTVEARILNGSDDVEEYAETGEMYLDSSDLEIVQESPGEDDPETQNVGLRFSEVGIPAGATITSARIQFTVDEADKTSDPFAVDIAIEDTESAARYTLDPRSVSDRQYLDQTVAWTDAPQWEADQDSGEAQSTPDLTELVQAVVDRDDWARGGALGFKLSGTGTRSAESYEGSPALGVEAPKLLVTYTLDGVTEVHGTIADERDDVEQYLAGEKAGLMDHGSSDLELVDEKPQDPGKNNQLVGLRYTNLDIPQGAEIISARVQFTVDEDDKNTDPFAVQIYGEATDDSAPYSDTDGDLAAREKTTAFAEWNDIPAWEAEHLSGPDQRTSELRDVVQEIIDREGWAPGNALTLLLTGEGQRSAESKDGEPDMAPELWISYRIPGAEQPEDEAPVTEEPGTDVTEEPETQEPGTDETEEPGTEEPSTDETEEPGTEEPGTDETEEPETQEPGTDETEEPSTEDPQTEAPKAEDPQTETPQATDPADAPQRVSTGGQLARTGVAGVAPIFVVGTLAMIAGAALVIRAGRRI